MGMDVYGNSPRSEKGEYFRNTVWYWHPLWDYCKAVAPQIIDGDTYTSGHYNDGAGLDVIKATALAEILQQEIDTGRTKEYEEAHQKRLDEMPDEECRYCKGTGKRDDNVARMNPVQMESCNGCNACGGTGKVRPFATSYPFETENVQEFVEFLRECGGFRIC